MGFEIKFFEKYFLSVVVCSFIDNTCSKHDPEATASKQVEFNASHIIRITSATAGEFYRIFTFSFSFWALFDTHLMNFIWMYVFDDLGSLKYRFTLKIGAVGLRA